MQQLLDLARIDAQASPDESQADIWRTFTDAIDAAQRSAPKPQDLSL